MTVIPFEGRVPRPPRRERARTRRADRIHPPGGLRIHINVGRFIDVRQASATYRLLGDEARLRLLRVLGRERLNVTELTGILGLAQSGVSRHLKLLKDAGFVVEEKDAGFSYYRLAEPAAGGAGGMETLWAALRDQFERSANDATVKADGVRLQEVLRLRKENFEQHGVDSRDGRQLVPGRSWAAWARALGMLLPPLNVADLGCGEGYLTIETSRWASTVIGVDRSEAVLARARALGRRRRAANVTWRRGELEKLPIDDESVDVALLSQALHHAVDPVKAVAEAARITVPGGRVLILDLREHHEEWVRAKLGDRTLGFKEEQLAEMLLASGLEQPRTRIGSSRAGDPFAVLIAAATKPAAAHSKKKTHR
jgi:SAM-dependent methyltransferase